MGNREYSHRALSEFALLANSFCDAILNRAQVPPAGQLEVIHGLLPRIYSAALQLPDTSVLFPEGEDADVADAPLEALPAVELPASLTELAGFLGMRRFYREVFDPYTDPRENEVTGDIVDDVGDIYVDLQRGLIHWRSGASGEALWAWRFNFQVHWGEHATSALRAIFALSAWHDVPWPAAAG
jgi:hypothetical protein